MEVYHSSTITVLDWSRGCRAVGGRDPRRNAAATAADPLRARGVGPVKAFGLTIAVVVLAASVVGPAHAQATASVLSIASPLDLPAIAQPLVICVDDAGRVMIAYKGKANRDADILPYRALLVNGSWQHAAIPLPQLKSSPSSLTLRGLAAGPGDGTFHLLAIQYGTGYYWRWQHGTWSQPETIENMGAVRGFCVLPDGSPLAEAESTRLELFRRGPQGWRQGKIPHHIGPFRVGPSLSLGAGGAVRALVRHHQVPVVATTPPGADPLRAESWTFVPPEVTSTMSSPAGFRSYQAALDWPHQLVFVLWEQRQTTEIKVAWAPIGATSLEQWQVADIPCPEGVRLSAARLGSNPTARWECW